MNPIALKAFIFMFSVFCTFDHSIAQEQLLFDLKQVADRPPPDVEKILGKPSKLVDDVFRGSRGSTIQQYGQPI
jgi:hypothetical protein